MAASSCTKDEETGPNPNGKVSLTITHQFKKAAIALGTPIVIDDSNSITINKLDYFISNITLRKADGSLGFTEPSSYHLVSLAGNGDATINLSTVPAGEYASLECYIGVDNVRNQSLDIIGDINPTNGMAWDWEIGYKFLRLEGGCSKGALSKPLVWHIGLNENFKKVKINLPQGKVVQNQTQKISVLANVDRLIVGTEVLLPLVDNNDIMLDKAKAAKVAANYASGFLVAAP